MSVTIDDQFLVWAGMSDRELREEIAVMLFTKQKLTCAQARRLTDMGRIEFYKFLAKRDISIMDEADIMQELEEIAAQWKQKTSEG
jgi:predicted HTH domain antitoxin